MTAGPIAYTPCTGCDGDGCAACDGAGYFAAFEPSPVVRAPHTAPSLPHAGPMKLTIATDGWAVRNRGTDDEHCDRRWAVCASVDGATPHRRYRNGGPVAVVRPCSGKEPPHWMRRAVSYVDRCGGLPLAVLPYVAQWFREHRAGEPDGGLVDSWGGM